MSIPADPAIAAALVRDLETPADILAELAMSPLAFLREGVATHPNVTADVLDSLVQERLDPVTDLGLALARAIARNTRTQSTTLAKIMGLLAPDKRDGARRENWPFEDLTALVLTHRNCPEGEGAAFLKRARLPRDPKARIARNTASREILEALKSKDSATVQRAAALNLRAPNDVQ